MTTTIESTITHIFESAPIHYRAGRLDEAADTCRSVLQVSPGHGPALHILGLVAHANSDPEAAAAWVERAIAARPGVSDFYNSLGVVRRRQGRHADAIAAYHQALTLEPKNEKALYNLANMLQQLGRFIEAAAIYRTAIAHGASDAAYYNLGSVLTKSGDLDASIAALRRATELRPQHASSYNNLGIALQLNGDLDGAMHAYQHAAECQPSQAHHFGNLVYTCMFHPAYDSGAQLDLQRRWNARYATPFRASRRPHDNERSPQRPLRIGYVCGDFRQHVLGLNMLPLIERHDRRLFEVWCLSTGRQTDAVTDRFKASAHWCELAGIDDDAAAELIRTQRIDVLVDLSMHMSDNRLLLFARKPAPVQVSFAGYPGGTGLETIDYRITDRYLDPPDSDINYREHSIRLPNSFWCYAPLGDEPAVNELPALTSGFVTFGCLNNFCKVNDGVLALWARVLSAVEGARLLLLAPDGSARQRVRDVLAKSGVDTSRLSFVDRLPRADYLRQFHHIDACLDTLPYNGHTTSLDSYYMGVPVITQIGATVSGRAGWSQLSNLGLTEFAASTPDQFVDIACRVAAGAAALGELRRTLRQRMEASPLMDAAGFAQAIEQAYRRMWTAWC